MILNINTNFSQIEQIKNHVLSATEVRDWRLIDIISTINRKIFLDDKLSHIANADYSIEYAPNRYLIDVVSLSKMLHTLDLQADDQVLVVGSGRGYSAFVLSHLVKQVTALEKNIQLHNDAVSLYNQTKINNIKFLNSNLEQGLLDKALQCNKIFIDGAFGYTFYNYFYELAKQYDIIVGSYREDYIAKIVAFVNNQGVVKDNVHDMVPVQFLAGYIGSSYFKF